MPRVTLGDCRTHLRFTNGRPKPNQKNGGLLMKIRHQHGYLRCAKRKNGPDVWEFLWREVGPNGRLIRRTLVVGTIEQYPTQQEASNAINGLRVSVNEACNRQ